MGRELSLPTKNGLQFPLSFLPWYPEKSVWPGTTDNEWICDVI